MNTNRDCGCKGWNSCLVCEKQYNLPPNLTKTKIEDLESYVYCPWCNQLWPGWDMNLYQSHPQHFGIPKRFPGVFIDMNFLNENEENFLMNGIDNMPWDLSQSGRRKQNFGPKCNFKRQTLQLGNFNGFPKFSKFVQDKFETIPLLRNYQTIEQCSLEYTPDRGAAIDLHIDDCWIWGERIVTVNLLSDSILTLIKYNGNENRYNLNCVKTYPPVIPKDEEDYKDLESLSTSVIRIPMPRRSLLVLYGGARYDWEHCVLREDILERRVCLAYREFTPPYLSNGCYENEGTVVIDRAKNFF
ncbi:alpha-ketoglutarate-dependent dioxygenase alkB homolog 4 [Chrysoperla carnea]|uniref:alpha-ketoglutarate-dependent dioxygenase alkB homolog 4 n=1 Tax=Chrysoperla carnea TaxID=189513 RepID=UPI001D0742B2|nr:alpha-ketoglutarate-dependent dioxygenase alkB homolog 4 [Chrysoperla carnea]